MARLYTNENLPQPVVTALRALGHDVLTTHDTGQSNLAIPDNEVLAYAQTQGRILLTLNRKDFVRLHRVGALHAGIVVCTFDPDFTALAQRIHLALATQSEWGGQVARVNRL